MSLSITVIYISNSRKIYNEFGEQLSAPFADYLDSIFDFCCFINTSPKKESLNLDEKDNKCSKLAMIPKRESLANSIDFLHR